MKLAKMSMVAALLLGANAYAIDNVKVNGDAKLYYATTDYDDGVAGDLADGSENGLFDKDASFANAALRLGVTADLTEGVSAGVTMTALSTLGMEGNLVSGIWESGAENNPTASDYWFSEAWLAGTAGKTTAKVGRQTLDTPLAFTETWSIAPNTFEAIVLINQDIADTTLIGAWIGSSNYGGDVYGAGAAGTGYGSVVADVTNDSRFSQFHNSGAYTIGAINNSFKPLTINAWYYEAPSTASAIWASADLDMEGILAGVQYTTFDPAASAAKDGDALAAMLGYAMKDVATIKVAYSTVDEEQGAGQNLAGVQTKMYTEMWWNYGNVVQAGADSIAVSLEGTVAGLDLFGAYYMADIDVAGTANDYEVSEITLSASKSFGPLDTSLVLIMDEYDYAPAAMTTEETTHLQVYLTYNF
jgi:hypothetical protein